MPALVVGAVVAGEDHERVLGDALLLEPVEQPADMLIEASDHRRMALVLLRPVFLGIRSEVGNVGSVAEGPRSLVVGMRHHEAPVEEEGLLALAADILQGSLGKEIVGKLHLLGGVAAAKIADRLNHIREHHLRLIFPEVFRKVVVGPVLTEIAEKLSEALLPRQAALGASHVAKPPLPKERRAVARR